MSETNQPGAVQPEQNTSPFMRWVKNIFYRGTHEFYDYGLVFVVLFLVLFGIIMVYSTTSYSDAITYNSAFFSVKKQLTFAGISFVLAIIISKLDYHWIVKLGLPIYLAAFALNGVVLFMGNSANGSQRWLNVGVISVQPSELLKPALVLVLAWYLVKFYVDKGANFWSEFKYSLIGLLFAVAGFGIVVKSNLSTALIIALIGYWTCYVTSKIKGIFPFLFIFVIVMIVVLYNVGALDGFLEGYRGRRIEAWLHPEQSKAEETHQVLQGLYAIGSGGIFGKGLGSSIQKLGFLPEAQNDMIFTIICEELGICGAFFVIALYVIMIFRLMFIANNAPDMTGAVLTTGIMIHMSLQVLLNIAVVTNLMPNTGITLPFISYGGSALMVLICEIGLALSVSNQIKVKGR